jgi:hypothetical protein
MKRYNKTKNKNNHKTKSRRKKRRTTFRMKGGELNPFSEFGTALSSLTNYIQTSIGTFTVPPIQGAQPVIPTGNHTQQNLAASFKSPLLNMQTAYNGNTIR